MTATVRDRDAQSEFTPSRPYEGAVPPNGAAPWTPFRRITFRFAFAYLVLYNLPFPLSLPPIGGPVAGLYNKLWFALIPWVAAHLLGMRKPITVFPAGSGDTRFNYVQLLVFITVAASAAAIWSYLDRSRPHYRPLAAWLRMYIRYALAVPLLVYGAAKVTKAQFPTPTLGTLLQPFSDFTPMSALWSWMGISPAYNLYAGLAEMIPGVLLFFRATTPLGALIGAFAMSNVVVMNFAYDVPVKLYSSHLLLMALFLLAPDVDRILGVLVLNRATNAADLGPYPSRSRWRVARYALKTGVICFAIGFPLFFSWSLTKQYGDRAARPPLYGIYDVASFARNGQPIPSLITDSTRWRRVLVNRAGAIGLQFMDGRSRQYLAAIDTSSHTMTLTFSRDSSKKSRLTYTLRGDLLSLAGLLGNDTVSIQLSRVDLAHFAVLRPGFHWVTE